MERPKVAIQWRAIGLRDKITPSNQGSVATDAPFRFSLNVLQPPPKEVIESGELAFGIFSLYSDMSGNGAFDRLLHPDFEKGFALIDSLSKADIAARAALMSVSETRQARFVVERYYLDAPAILTKADGESPDTVWSARNPEDAEGAIQYLVNREAILINQNRWQRFFERRKKDNAFRVAKKPALGHYQLLELSFNRTLFPKPGQEAEFENRVGLALRARIDLNYASNAFLYESAVTGKMDYPFAGYDFPGQDWMAGRAIEDLILYLPDRETLDTLLDAIPESSFRFTHLQRLHPGYNLFHCTDQYDCDVRAPGDSIHIILGTSEAYFNAPPTPSRDPFRDLAGPAAPPQAAVFAALQGRYAQNGYDTVSVAVRNGSLWCETTERGLIRVLPVDSLGFRSPILEYQGIFTPGSGTRTRARIVEYDMSARYVGLSLGLPVLAEVLDRIDRAELFARADIPDSMAARCEGAYDYGGDSLKIEKAGGDSLRARIPGFPALVFHAVNETLFRCPWGEYSLEFQGFNGTGYARLIFGNGPARKVVPNYRVSPSYWVKSGRQSEAGVAWSSEEAGTGRDTYMDLSGRKRYACSRDGRFLRAGDGYLAKFSRSGPDDSISLRQNGDFATFRFPGLKGKTVFFELGQCAEKGAKAKRVRISIWGGAGPEAQRPLYGDHQWLATDTSETYWGLDSLVMDADPYYLTLKQEDTRDAPFANAFDGYRLGIRP